MEKLSGLQCETVIGKPCLPEYALTELFSIKEQAIRLSQADGIVIEVKKSVRILRDKTGAFAGGFGLFFAHTERSPDKNLPKTSTQAGENFHGIISRSPAMRDVFQIIQNAAETEATVLVRGESGAGKELVARAIHDLSTRQNAPFLAINCAALSSNLLESELFGHEKGAFTGAMARRPGRFAAFHSGCLTHRRFREWSVCAKQGGAISPRFYSFCSSATSWQRLRVGPSASKLADPSSVLSSARRSSTRSAGSASRASRWPPGSRRATCHSLLGSDLDGRQ